MSNLQRIEISADVRQAVQESLPHGQVIRHLGLVFELLNEPFVGSDGQTRTIPRVGREWFLAVSDSVLAFREMQWAWDLTAHQQRFRDELEANWNADGVSKGKWAGRLGSLAKLGSTVQTDPAVSVAVRTFRDQEIAKRLLGEYGTIERKWDPRITASKDYLISEVALVSYDEIHPDRAVALHFNHKAQRVDQIARIRYTVNGTTSEIGSLFGDLRDIYALSRDSRMQGPLGNSHWNLMSKCVNCGSTELTVSGSYFICSYCQSKFTR